MKKFIALLGLLCGMAAALAGLAFNPLATQPVSLPDTQETYGWQALEFIGSPLAAADMLGVSALVSGTVPLDKNLQRTHAAILLLTDENGQARGLATRLSTLADNNNMLLGRVGVDTYTNVFWPNRGSVLMQGYENRWALIRSKLLELAGTPAMSSYLVSGQPPLESNLGIAGGSGELTATGGRYSEMLAPAAEMPGTFNGVVSLDIALR